MTKITHGVITTEDGRSVQKSYASLWFNAHVEEALERYTSARRWLAHQENQRQIDSGSA